MPMVTARLLHLREARRVISPFALDDAAGPVPAGGPDAAVLQWRTAFHSRGRQPCSQRPAATELSQRSTVRARSQALRPAGARAARPFARPAGAAGAPDATIGARAASSNSAACAVAVLPAVPPSIRAS